MELPNNATCPECGMILVSYFNTLSDKAVKELMGIKKQSEGDGRYKE